LIFGSLNPFAPTAWGFYFNQSLFGEEMKVRFLLPALGALCCCWSEMAHADLKWTEVMTFGAGQKAGAGEDGPGKMTMTTNKWVKREATRSETSFSVGPMQMTNADIMRCDTKETVLLDADLKMYAIVPASAGGAAMGMPGMGNILGAPKGKAGRGTSVTEVLVQDLGKETINTIETRHYSVKMKNTATGCAGNGTTESTMEMWVADIRMPALCQQVDYKTGLSAALRQDASCDITSEIKGDTTALQKVYDGFVMRMKMGGVGGAPGFLKEVTMLSQAELDETPFTIPADWKKVSEKQLQDAKQKAMMKKMMEGMKNGDVGDEE
jgi:hypothetical protein